MESKSTGKGKSNVPLYVLTLVGLAIYGATTYIVTEVAGGTGVHADESNTPNAVVPGPPPFK
jgi:hypothetical protein